jgi:plastocyanin
MRRSMRASLAGMAIGGLVITGCGGGSGNSNGGTASTADVVVRGDDALKFDQAQYTAKAGSVTIELSDDGSQPHTLLIEKVSSFNKLTVTGKGDKATGTATLDPGTYTIYCDIAGHRSAGMEAKLVVN